MAEYIDKGIALDALESKKKEREKKYLENTHNFISDSVNAGRLFGITEGQRMVYDIPAADVVEREKIDKAIAEMEKLAAHRVRPISFDQSVAVDMCIQILKRNMGE